jgi:hypothetical protein
MEYVTEKKETYTQKEGIIFRNSDNMYILFNKEGKECAFPETCNLTPYFAKGFTSDKPDLEAKKTEEAKAKEELRQQILKEMEQEKKKPGPKPKK